MLSFPVRHGAIEGVENASYLLWGWFSKPATMFPVESLNLGARYLHVSHAAACIQPKLLAFSRIARRLNGRIRRIFRSDVLTLNFCRRDIELLGIALPWVEMLFSSRFVGHVHTTIHEHLKAY